MVHQIHTYAELRDQIHEDLRSQHPEWIKANGESPLCDSYEARLMKTLQRLNQSERNNSFEAIAITWSNDGAQQNYETLHTASGNSRRENI